LCAQQQAWGNQRGAALGGGGGGGSVQLTEVSRMPAAPSMAQRPCTSSACTYLHGGQSEGGVAGEHRWLQLLWGCGGHAADPRR
jgi:hypothetical protein